eukprot:CAMPEP_0174264740 /NCGR_PEP_ID=MMETSP0439-20130205/23720_1 /TAXON_ID=0 /ORGANISM="Stereomyxa ramosa, Strain Chinc5" /LENGTH=648 /DNA_ID=CAMNT_0015350787 /DNA_START=28 /DNA_END=1970 /DNA_ORIENTATION=+
MLIFVKSPTGRTFTIDVELTDTIADVEAKLSEFVDPPFGLAYAGKILQSGTLQSNNVKMESILHLVPPKKVQVLVVFKGESRPVEVPSLKVTVRDLKRQVRNVFPEEESFGRSLPILKNGSTVLSNSKSLAACGISGGETLVAKRVKKTNRKYKEKEIAEEQDTLDESWKEELLMSFAQDAVSNEVEIVFSFDTTGSMAPCLFEVRKKLSETVQRLMKDIPKIRIGIIAHGDFCDYNTYVVKTLDLSQNVDEICEFVNGVAATTGGDAPEAYELALQEATRFSWSPGCSKALVLIGDNVPHPPSYTTEAINWFDECDTLRDMGVKIYGVRALEYLAAAPFYEYLSERTGAISIQFSNFNLIVDMFLAICYREASPEQLQEFEQELKEDGKMNEEMGHIFETLAKPNAEIKDKNKKKEDVIELKCTAPWFDLRKDNGTPGYTLKDGKWMPVNATYSAPSYSSTPSYSTSSYSTPSNVLKMVVIGDGAVGKTSMLMSYTSGTFPTCYVPSSMDNQEVTIDHAGKSYTMHLWDTAGQEDYDRLRPLSYPGTHIFLVCFSIASDTSFRNISAKWLPEIQRHCPGVPFLIIGTKGDLTESRAVTEREAKEFAEKAGSRYLECSAKAVEGLDAVFSSAVDCHLANLVPQRSRSS